MTSTGWNVTLEDTSPIFQYLPYGDGYEPSNGWSQFFGDSGGLMRDNGNKPTNNGLGDSFHVTSLNGANLTLEFRGTGVHLYGHSNATFDIILDDSKQTIDPTNLQNDILFSSDGLQEKGHTIKLAAYPVQGSTEQLAFSKAEISMSLPLGQNSVPSPTTYQNIDPVVKYSGSWAQKSDPKVPNLTNPAPYHVTSSIGAGFSMAFKGGNAIAVRGNLNLGHGAYSVRLDDMNAEFNGSTFWFVGDSVLFFQAFGEGDDSKVHTLNVTNLGGGGASTLSHNAIDLWGGTALSDNSSSVPSSTSGTGGPTSGAGSSTSQLSGGAIAGIVIGCLAFVALTFAGMWGILKIRKRGARRLVDAGLQDGEEDRGISPFTAIRSDRSDSTERSMTSKGPLTPGQGILSPPPNAIAFSPRSTSLPGYSVSKSPARLARTNAHISPSSPRSGPPGHASENPPPRTAPQGSSSESGGRQPVVQLTEPQMEYLFQRFAERIDRPEERVSRPSEELPRYREPRSNN